MKIPIAQIVIGERQRLEYGDLSDLDSMEDPAIGMIVPVILRQLESGQYELVDGARRLQKAISLGWTEVDYVNKGAMPELVKQECELYADIGRKDRTWREKCLAIEKLFKLKKLQKDGLGETWTVRTMAAMLGKGYSKSSVNYMMQIAEEIRTNPSGDIAQADGYTNAVKHLIIRHEREVNTEMERRRQGLVVTMPPTGVAITAEEINAKLDDEYETVAEDTDVQLLDTTPELVVLIRGSKTYPKQQFKTVIAMYEEGVNAPTWLAPDGHCIMVFKEFLIALGYMESSDQIAMPFPLIWDKYLCAPFIKWPFDQNYEIGVYFRGNAAQLPQLDKPLPAVVKCVQSIPGQLPRQVIHHILNAIGVPNGPVLCLGNIDLVAVAEWGAVPIWVEPDAVRFNERAEELENHYINTIPGVVVKRQE